MTSQRHVAPPRRLLDEDDDDVASSSSSSSRAVVAFSPFGSSRHLNLRSFATDRPIEYVEVKIGGHALDHVRMLDATPHLASTRRQGLTLHHPDHNAWWRATDRLASSRAFETHTTPKLEYACVKIGGHALDHVPFVGRGLPSRPLWDNVRLVLHPPRRWSNSNVRQRMLHVGRVLQVDATACRRCGKMRALPRIQLCCGHPLCVECLASTTLRHVELGDGICLVECTACGDCLAVEAVVFPNRVLYFPMPDVRSLATMQQHMHMDGGRRYRIDWRLGTAAAALAVAARRLLYGHSSVTSALQSDEEAPMLLSPLSTLELPSTSDASSADRWHKRLESLQPPSRLLSYEFVRTLGVGNFAEVMLVKRKNGKLMVVKESDRLQEAVNEIRLLAKIRCPHVVRIHHYFVEAIGHRQFAYIEMEYCDGGDLAQWIKQHGRLQPAMFDRIFRQLCLGLAEIHRHAIVHRDIKPGNVLLTATGIAKIADFGVSTCLESDLATHHAAGTLAFMAPEVRRYFLGENVSYGLQADVWSLGALALAMLVGDPEPQIATRSVESWLAELRRQDTPERYVSLVRQTLADDPTKRPSLSTLLASFPAMSARL